VFASTVVGPALFQEQQRGTRDPVPARRAAALREPAGLSAGAPREVPGGVQAVSKDLVADQWAFSFSPGIRLSMGVQEKGPSRTRGPYL
jgi:hypothetical protein